MQQGLKWTYYNHAILSTAAPHEAVEAPPLKGGRFWKSVKGGKAALLARWTSDFDCQESTDWWYIIKDAPFNLMDVKANYRYKINKGRKHFDVRPIKPAAHAEALYQVQVDAFSAYPAKYRPKVDYDRFVASLSDWRNGITFAAFQKEGGSLAGYTYIAVHEGYLSPFRAKNQAEPGEAAGERRACLWHT